MLTTKQARRNPALRQALARVDSRKPPLLSGDEIFEFRVVGEPAEQGSMHPYTDDRGRARLGHNDRSLKHWRRRVQYAATLAMGLRGPVAPYVAILVGFEFILQRTGPMAHLPWPTFKHDEDKYTRAMRDALSGVLYADDGQVVGPSINTGGATVALPQCKRWAKEGERAGVIVRTRLCPEPKVQS